MSETRERYWWKNTESQQILNRGYLLQGESVEGAIDRVCSAAAKNLFRPELKEAFKEMVERGWMSLSSPIWANMGTERGLPISCFNVHVPDRIEDITHKLGEVIMQTKIGGGTSGYFGSLRERGSAVKDNGKSSGAVSFMKLFDTTMDTISQGGVRRGAFAAYLDIDHPDIEEFLAIKSIGSPIQNLFYAVCVPDYWLNEMIEGDMEKRKTWAKVLENRQQKGLPYIFFTDNINRNKPQVYKDKGMMINASNLCSEIVLPSSKDESFICCLSSLNLEMYDEWKDTETVKLATFFLDAVLEEFIKKTEGNHYLENAHNFAKRHRALGLGVLGWHSYLQRNMIPFEGLESKQLTNKIFKDIQEKSEKATIELARIYGEPEVLEGYGRRNTTLLAIAPTTSSSAILGQASPGIEPLYSNYYKAGLAKGNFMRKNKYLETLLKEDTDFRLVGIVRNPMATLWSWKNAPNEFKKDWNFETEWQNANLKNQGLEENFYGYMKWKEVANLFELLKTYSTIIMTKDFQTINIPKLPVFTTEEGIKQIKNNLNHFFSLPYLETQWVL